MDIHIFQYTNQIKYLRKSSILYMVVGVYVNQWDITAPNSGKEKLNVRFVA